MVSDDKKGDAIFQLRAVELHELNIKKPILGTPPVANFNFEISIETTVDHPQKIVIVATRVNIKGNDQQTDLGSIICACIFSVANFDEVVTMHSPTSAEVSHSFAEALNSIAISTTRGVMFSELKGTVLHHAFLPIIDIKSLAKAPVAHS